MACRKRRRYRLANIVSYLCTVVGLTFVVSNVFMLRRGFVQLYSAAYRGPYPERSDRPPDSYDIGADARWRATGVSDRPRVELPASALAAELQLRKLMENPSRTRLFGRPLVRPDYESLLLGADDAKYLRRRQIMAPRPPYGVSLISVTSRDLRRFLNPSSDCSGLRHFANLSVVGSGWTKLVYEARYQNKPVALKTIDLSGHDLASCMNDSRHDRLSHCYENVALKLLKEIILVRRFDNPHIVKPLAHCVPLSPFTGQRSDMVTLATELGEGVDIIKLLHLSWEDRLKISYGLSKLLYYLAHSPYGSVIVSDFRRQQFVLVDGDIKLTDLDDVGFSERECRTDHKCLQYFSSVNLTLRTKCISGQCLGLNEKINIFNAARHFTTFLLPHGSPRPLRPRLDQMVNDFSNVTKTAKQLLQDITIIIDDYSTGAYLNRTGRDKTSYRVVPHSDMPGQYDYNCQYCMDGSGCTVSVYDVKEAEEFCDADTQCRAVVLTNTRTWTGRILAHLKNGIGRIKGNTQTMLYIKPTM